jgi:hypothetical protein
MPASWILHPFSGARIVRHDVHPRRVEPDKERPVLLSRLVDEFQGLVADDLVDGFRVVLDVRHRVRRQRAFVGDFAIRPCPTVEKVRTALDGI